MQMHFSYLNRKFKKKKGRAKLCKSLGFVIFTRVLQWKWKDTVMEGVALVVMAAEEVVGVALREAEAVVEVVMADEGERINSPSTISNHRNLISRGHTHHRNLISSGHNNLHSFSSRGHNHNSNGHNNSSVNLLWCRGINGVPGRRLRAGVGPIGDPLTPLLELDLPMANNRLPVEIMLLNCNNRLRLALIAVYLSFNKLKLIY